MKRTFRVAWIVLVVVAAVALSAWLARVPILQGVAHHWVVSDPIENADAIAVLGGGINTRPFVAAELYKAGKSKVILVPVVKASPSEELLLIRRHSEINRAILLKLGVEAGDIVDVGNEVTNTYQEMLAVSEWAQRTGAKKIIVVSELFASRRVKWIGDRELSKVGAKVILRATPPLDYDFQHWWQSEQGIVSFQNELLKYIYYRVKY